VEIEFEGSEDFLRDELMEIVSAVSTLYSAPTGSNEGSDGNGGGAEPADQRSEGGVIGTTGTLAARLNAKTGPELALAAAAHLTLVRDQHTFRRRDILTEMQSAPSYYNKNYSSNFSHILGSLVKEGKLVETAKETYALSASEKTSLKSRLAERS
jgi:hypothetical protein